MTEPDSEPAGEPDTQPGTPPDWSEPDRAFVMASLAKLGGDQAEATARLSAAEDRLEDLAIALDGIEDAAAAATAGASVVSPGSENDADRPDPADSDDAGNSGLDMAELVAWVRDHVALLLERKLPQTGTPPHWCRRWWLHAEAIARFEAARRCWAEAVTGEGSAMVVYFEHLDHQLAALMGEGGPFTGCTGGEHRHGAVAVLGHDEPDPAYFAQLQLLDTG